MFLDYVGLKQQMGYGIILLSDSVFRPRLSVLALNGKRHHGKKVLNLQETASTCGVVRSRQSFGKNLSFRNASFLPSDVLGRKRTPLEQSLFDALCVFLVPLVKGSRLILI